MTSSNKISLFLYQTRRLTLYLLHGVASVAMTVTLNARQSQRPRAVRLSLLAVQQISLVLETFTCMCVHTYVRAARQRAYNITQFYESAWLMPDINGRLFQGKAGWHCHAMSVF